MNLLQRQFKSTLQGFDKKQIQDNDQKLQCDLNLLYNVKIQQNPKLIEKKLRIQYQSSEPKQLQLSLLRDSKIKTPITKNQVLVKPSPTKISTPSNTKRYQQIQGVYQMKQKNPSVQATSKLEQINQNKVMRTTYQHIEKKINFDYEKDNDLNEFNYNNIVEPNLNQYFINGGIQDIQVDEQLIQQSQNHQISSDFDVMQKTNFVSKAENKIFKEKIKATYNIKDDSQTCKNVFQDQNLYLQKQNSIDNFKYKKIILTKDQQTLCHQNSTGKKNFNLTDEEKEIYGNRFIDGYEKIDLLGRGGFALVWLAYDLNNQNRKVAIKQMIKQKIDNFNKEVDFIKKFFDLKGNPNKENENDDRIDYLIRLLDRKKTSKDVWLVYELGGTPLSKCISEMKGSFNGTERIYQIVHFPFYQNLVNSDLMKKFIVMMAQAIELMSEKQVVHADLKPENILIKLNDDHTDIESLKIIDFGTSFSLLQKTDSNISMATPEYMPPEMLEIISNSNKYTNQNRTQIEVINEVIQPWSVDVWSLGAILLEIMIGVPHWLSYKCSVQFRGKITFKYGYFAVKGRAYDKIILKQRKFCENFDAEIQKNCQFLKSIHLVDLVKKMMLWNPSQRISPSDILQHNFINQ